MAEGDDALADQIIFEARARLQSDPTALARLDNVSPAVIDELIKERLTTGMIDFPPVDDSFDNPTGSILRERPETLIAAVAEALVTKVMLDD